MLYDRGREPNISKPKELIATTIFTLAMVLLIIHIG